MDALRPTRRVVQAPGSAKVAVIRVRNPARIVFDMEMNEPVLILEDNQSTIQLCYNKMQQQRSKHIDVRYFCVRHLIKCGLVKVRYIPSDANTADCGTKSLGRVLFNKHVEVLFGKAAVELHRVKTLR